MRRSTKVIVVVYFLALVSAPLAAMLAGVKAAEIENRALVQAPQVTPGKALDAATYQELGAWYEDRLPWRQYAVELDGWIDYRVFDDSPNPEVGIGSDGWLFYARSYELPCQTDDSIEEIVGRLGTIARIVEASGRDFIYVPGPNKEAIYPEFVGRLESQVSCARDKRAQLRALLAEEPVPGFVDMWTILEREKPLVDEPLYWPNDSHWTSSVSALVAEIVVDRLDPALWDPGALRRRSGDHEGDLTRVIGIPSTVPTVNVTVDRKPAVRTSELDSNNTQGPNDYVASGDGDVFEGRLFVVHDSFLNGPERMINQYVSMSTFVHNNVLSQMENPWSWVALQVADSDAFLVEAVERGMFRLGDGLIAQLAEPLVAALVDDLPSIEVGVVDGSNGSISLTVPLTSPGVSFIVLDLDALGPSVDAVPGVSGRPLVLEAVKRLVLRVDEKAPAEIRIPLGGAHVVSARLVVIP